MRTVAASSARLQVLCLLVLAWSVLAPLSRAGAVTITADTVEYFKEDNRFEAKGNVVIEKEGTTLYADEATFFRDTSDAVITGNMVYDNGELVIQAEGAEFNLEKKSGKLKKAVIFFRKDNYWISGENMEKIDDTHYYAPTATITTCNVEPYLMPDKFKPSELKGGRDASKMFDEAVSGGASGKPAPDWCFKGEKVNLTVGDTMTARNVVYRIKGLPTLYAPYFSAPIGKDRQTGFLMPAFGNSSSKGFEFSPVFYWAIADDKDATFYADYFSKRGTGLGIEYRQITTAGLNSWFGYYLHDRFLDKDFVEVKGKQYLRFGEAKGYLDVHYLNDSEFYNQYGFSPGAGPSLRYTGINRFLQSSGELYVTPGNSRLYLLGQYWVDLSLPEQDTVLQKLPEVGYAIHPTNLGPFVFTLSSSAANFFRDEGIKGQRLDVFPTISYSFGDAVQLFQSLSVRETAYFLNQDEPFGSSPHRESLEYRANAQMRFVKNYGRVMHIFEPSLEYAFIPHTKDVPLFDSVDLFDRISTLRLTLSNVLSGGGLSLWFRLIQGYDLDPNGPAEPFLPTRFQATVVSPFPLRMDMSYDFNTGKMETFNAETGIRLFDRVTLSVADRYSRTDNVQYYSASAMATVTPRLSLGGSVSYDATGVGLREYVIRSIYNDQCWGVTAAFTRRPPTTTNSADYNFFVMVELKGLAKFRLL